MKLIVISGARNSKKDLLAMRLSSSLDCVWIKPYSNRKVPINSDPVTDFIPLNDNQLNDKLEREESLAETIAKGNRYIYFINQLKGDYSIITGDDSIMLSATHNWNGDITTIKCHSDKEMPSVRCLMSDNEFDVTFHYEDDDFEELLEMIR